MECRGRGVTMAVTVTVTTTEVVKRRVIHGIVICVRAMSSRYAGNSPAQPATNCVKTIPAR